jgi:hypothetical protein
MSNSSIHKDVEKSGGEYTQLINTSVHTFGWKDVTVTVNDRHTKQPKDILQNVNGIVKAGKENLITTSTMFLNRALQAK